MEKAKAKRRDIKYFSEKNRAVMCVHNQTARDFASWLENQTWVESYDVNVILDHSRYPLVNPIEIRSSYFDVEWATDFLIRFVDQRQAVREICSVKSMQKLATIEKLEISRRYWKAAGITDWKIVLPKDDQEEGYDCF